jgi:hypothetical protein
MEVNLTFVYIIKIGGIMNVFDLFMLFLLLFASGLYRFVFLFDWREVGVITDLHI